jgi:hypothetical protein
VEAGNVLIHFPSLQRLKFFLDYLESIDPCHYKAINSGKGLARDVYLPVGETSVDMAFSVDEFEELRQMLRHFWDKETGSDPCNLNFLTAKGFAKDACPTLRINLNGVFMHISS